MKNIRAGNYMAYNKNRLRFGKLVMNDADLVLIDMDPNDPLDFYLEHYKEQLSAGYTKITPGSGLLRPSGQWKHLPVSWTSNQFPAPEPRCKLKLPQSKVRL